MGPVYTARTLGSQVTTNLNVHHIPAPSTVPENEREKGGIRGLVRGKEGGRVTHWRHVVGCSHKCFSKTEVMVEDSGQTKVSQLYIVIAIEKHISWFQIAMKNLQREGERK